MKLNKRTVEGLSLPESGQRFVWDSELRGFGVRLNPSGRTYIIQSRVNGVSRRITIGHHGVLTCEEARKKAAIELAGMLQGVDPVIEKAREAAYSLTLKELVEEYIRVHRDLKKRSTEDIERHLKANFAEWSGRPVIEITREKVAVKFRELADRSPAQANQAFRIVRAVLNYARAAHRPDNRPILIENPVDILSQTKVWNRVQAKSGRIPTAKIGAAWNATQEIRGNDFASTVAHTGADITAFLVISGARWSEAAQLEWSRVNLDEKWWYLPDPKNRQSVRFPLSDVAAEILSNRSQKGQYVFPGRSDGCIKDVRETIAKIGQVAGAHITAHDLRRTFRAIAGECQIELWKTKLLMGHKLSGDVTITHYTETSDLRYLSPEINMIANWITAKAMEAATDKVVPFPTQQRGA